ncbi:hypothetical protein [Streptomyces sp. NPDC058953]
MTREPCARCRELAEQEREADAAGDYSRAVDCRVLRRRHEETEH